MWLLHDQVKEKLTNYQINLHAHSDPCVLAADSKTATLFVVTEGFFLVLFCSGLGDHDLVNPSV